MLRHTFCHLPGIGHATEQRLWAEGLETWDALAGALVRHVGPRRRDEVSAALDRSGLALEEGDALYFSERLRPADRWRMFPTFSRRSRPDKWTESTNEDLTSGVRTPSGVAYFDIETTGLSRHQDHVTTAVLYDGRSVRHYIHGDNMGDLDDDLSEVAVLVTYNGVCFDLPFIESTRGLRFRGGHIDLRYVLAGLGLRGGLKRCEEQIGLVREGLDGVDGYMAVRLWHEHRRGRRGALETLLAYNVADVLNLERLMWHACEAMAQRTPFGSRVQVEEPRTAANPFEVDRDLVRRLVALSAPSWS